MFLKVPLPVDDASPFRTSLAPHRARPAIFQSDHRDSVRLFVPHPSRVHSRRPVPSLNSTPSGNISTFPHDCLVLVSPPLLYHGPIDRASWFLAIFGPSPHRVFRVTLVLFSGSPHRTGLPPLATLDTLPGVVEYLESSPIPLRAISVDRHPLFLGPSSTNDFHPVAARLAVYVHFH